MTMEPESNLGIKMDGGIPMRHPSSQMLFSHWDDVRGDGVPERGDIDVVALKSILADVFFAERTPKDFLMFQFVGTRINALHGFDLQHRSSLGIWSAASASEFIKVIERMTMHGVPTLISSEGIMRDHEKTEIETLLLPLRYGSRCTRFVGTHVNLGKPRALWHQPLTACRIQSTRPLFSDRGSSGIENPNADREPDVFANVVSIAQAYGGRRIGHLTVIDGGLATS